MRRGLSDNLEFEGYDVLVSDNGEDGLAMILEESPDLVLLDLMLPRMDGVALCRKVREQNRQTPIIMLTAKGHLTDKVTGLEVGADDYVTKPFSLHELLARIRAVLRRVGERESDPQSSRIGDVALDLEGCEVVRDGIATPISHRESEILRILLENQGKVVSRDLLLNQVWGLDRFPTTRTVDNHIVRLRKLIEPDPKNPHWIVTIHGMGYKLSKR